MCAAGILIIDFTVTKLIVLIFICKNDEKSRNIYSKYDCDYDKDHKINCSQVIIDTTVKGVTITSTSTSTCDVMVLIMMIVFN